MASKSITAPDHVDGPQLRLVSFGFGHDAPAPDADLVLDLREWFRDPHVSPELRELTGRDPEVIANVLSTTGVGAFVDKLFAVLTELLQLGHRTVTVAAGCTGGRHRSVVIADQLAYRARSAGWTAEVDHRDLAKPVLTGRRRAASADRGRPDVPHGATGPAERLPGRYFEAPHYYRPRPGDNPAVFLAGGITGCPRWHDHASAVLATAPVPPVVLNPNRREFPINDPAAGWEQVSWEQHHLHLPAALTLFWFPASDAATTTQPIAMFELGQSLGEGRRIVVGADPGYPRAADVRMLCQLARPGMPVHDTLDDTLAAVLDDLGQDARLRSTAA